MNRILSIGIVGLVFLAAAVGLVLFLQSGTTSAPTQVQQGQVNPNSQTTVTVPVASEAAKQAVKAAIQKIIDASDQDNTKLYKTSVVGAYALQEWKGDVMGGQALVEYDSAKRQWVLVDGGGGEWSVESLVGAGVPQDTAAALLQGLQNY